MSLALRNATTSDLSPRRRMRFSNTHLLLIPLVLAACSSGGQDKQTPVTITVPGTPKGDLRNVSFDVSIDSRVLQGANSGATVKAPEGMRMTYFFGDTGMRTMVDVPGAQFPDQQARLIASDPAANDIRILLKSTMKADVSISPDLVTSMKANIANPGGDILNMLNDGAPFRRMSVEQFTAKARSLSFDLTDAGTGQLTVVKRTIVLPQGKASMTLSFDQSIGAVSSAVTEFYGQDIQTLSTSTVSYTTMPDMNGVILPEQITSTMSSEVIGDAAQPPIELPVANETIPSTASGPSLAPGEYVAQSFGAPPGQGTTDINKFKIETRITFRNTTVNGPDVMYPEDR